MAFIRYTLSAGKPQDRELENQSTEYLISTISSIRGSIRISLDSKLELVKNDIAIAYTMIELTEQLRDMLNGELPKVLYLDSEPEGDFFFRDGLIFFTTNMWSAEITIKEIVSLMISATDNICDMFTYAPISLSKYLKHFNIQINI